MGFLSIVRKLKLKEHEFKILILGLDNSGKSTILKAFLKEDVSAVEPTVGFSIRSQVYSLLSSDVIPKERPMHQHESLDENFDRLCTLKKLGNASEVGHDSLGRPRQVKLSLWDIGGQSTIRQFWSHYYNEKCDGIIWVLDATDHARFKTEAHSLLQSVLTEGKLQGASLLIMANKMDLPDAMSLHDVKSHLLLEEQQPIDSVGTPSLRSVLMSHSFRIVPCSALKNINIETSVDWLVQDIVARLYPPTPVSI